MSKIEPLVASIRDRAGKGAARATRREGHVPAVIYGGKQDPVSIAIEWRELNKKLSTGKFLSSLFMVDTGKDKIRVIPRDVQYHPVTDVPMHVDFLRLMEGDIISVELPMVFLNEEECPGITRGGTLNVVRHSVEVNVPVDAIPDHLEADLTGLEIGDGVHISSVKLPEGVTPTITDRDFTIATIAAPSALLSEEAEAEEAEGEEAEEGAEGEEGATEEGGEEEEKSED
jgi:large subunit ribosomal protein L25